MDVLTRRTRRVLLAACFVLVPHVALAQTDLLIVPFVGTKFGTDTSIAIAGTTASGKKLTFGLSAMILTDKFLGVEADLGQTPQFFGGGAQDLITSSVETTLTGNVIIAVPKMITQESLRPYLIGGLGLMHTRVSTSRGVLDTKSDLLGLDIGGGAIGMLSPRAGARFELRRFRNLTSDSGAVTIGGTKLSFWRLTAGLVLRY